MRKVMMVISLGLFLSAQPMLEARNHDTKESAKATKSTILSGKASYYSNQLHGKRTASGEVYNMNGLSAAHKTLRFGTKVKITNTSNGKSVIVKVNDRGPYVASRQFDLSKAAFSTIASSAAGVINIKYEIVD